MLSIPYGSKKRDAVPALQGHGPAFPTLSIVGLFRHYMAHEPSPILAADCDRVNGKAGTGHPH
jgi:hypothetical protein